MLPVTDFRKSQVTLGSAAPMPEAIGGSPGAGGQASRVDHRHPRLTAPHTGTLDANGEASFVFDRTFKNMPVVISSWVESANNPPVVFKVKSWLKPDGSAWAAGSLYGGCVIKGYRGQLLPALTSILLIGPLITALANFNVFNGSAAGLTYMTLPVQVGDETSV